MSALEPTNTVEDPTLNKRWENKQKDKANERAAGLTIADRLTRRALGQTVELIMSDGGGEFPLVMRQPTRAQMEEMRQLQAAIQVEATQDEANDKICIMLDRICIDDSLDYQFWLDGNYSMGDLIDIVNKLFESIVVRVKAAQSFRDD